MNNNYNANFDVEEIKGTKQRSSRLRKFLTIVFSIVSVFLIGAGAFTYMYMNSLINGDIELDLSNISGQVLGMINKPANNRITGVIFGLDKGGMRTDVILVCTVDKANRKIDVVSVPRDTRVALASEKRLELKELGKYVPSGGIMKLNEVHAYAPRDKRDKYSVDEVERVLDGIKIDYYAAVDVTAFRKIVDTLGGVEFEVKSKYKNGLNYDDPVQGLHIHLKNGVQVLDGSQAEQLVRFRKYLNGDLDRIKVQQDFLKAFYRKVISVKNIGTMVKIATTLYQYLDTNFGVADIPEAVNIVYSVDIDNVTMHVLPGEPQTIDGASYFIYDKDKTKELVDEIFRGKDTSYENKTSGTNGSELEMESEE